jgi:hypothetical protein
VEVENDKIFSCAIMIVVLIVIIGIVVGFIVVDEID